MRAVVQLGPIVEDAVRGAQRLAALPVQVPREAQARREVGPLAVYKALRNPRIADERKPRGSVDVDAADLAGGVAGRAEMIHAVKLVAGGQERLPAQPDLRLQPGSQLEVIVDVKTGVLLARVGQRRVALLETA